jgi:hypothetical protein
MVALLADAVELKMAPKWLQVGGRGGPRMRSWLQRYVKFRRERIPPSPELRCMPLPPDMRPG